MQLAQEPLILEGGYSLWYLTYSPLCVGKPKRKEKPSSEDGTSGQADKEEGRIDCRKGFIWRGECPGIPRTQTELIVYAGFRMGRGEKGKERDDIASNLSPPPHNNMYIDFCLIEGYGSQYRNF